MAQDISLMGADYEDVPAINLPKTGGGEALFTDISESTITEDTVAAGFVGFSSLGEKLIGTANTYKYGSISLSERSFIATIDTGVTDFRYLLLFTNLSELQKTGVKYNCLIFADFNIQRASVAVQNNSGTDWVWWNNPFTYANSIITRSDSVVTIENRNKSVKGNSIGYFQPLTYNWIVWG